MLIFRVTLFVIISLFIGSVPTYAGSSFSKIVVFGDSNVDSGAAQEGSLYNLTYGELTALGPPNVGGRSCNGPVVVEYVAEMLKVPLEDYGVGGAMTGLKNYLPDAYPGILYVYPLIEYTGVLSQLNNFQTSLGKRKADSQALYIYWAGSNDLFNATSENLLLKINTALDNIKIALTTLNNLGARYIVVATRTVRRDYSSQNNINGIILNARLRILVQQLNEELKANIQIFEAFDLTTEMTYNPDTYGFIQTTAPCIIINSGCDTYISWDDVHKTTKVHKLMAEEIVIQALNMIQDED